MENKNFENELVRIRRELHKIPELAFEEFETSKLIKKELEKSGYEVTTGIGKTGLVASLKVGNSDKIIGIRADMDAINIQENNNFEYKSKFNNKMHACGHDGHIATALGAAKLIAENKEFNGTVRFIFQPAEEPGEGALAMIKDNVLERFPMDEIYAIHNMPQLPEGEIHSRVGAIMGSEDNFEIKVNGVGGHASSPNLGVDPLVVSSEIILALQTIISRNINPIEPAVISCTDIQTDGTRNVIPSSVVISGDVRTYSSKVQNIIKERIDSLCKNISKAYGATCEFDYVNSFFPTINDRKCHETVIKAGKNLFEENKVIQDTNPLMTSEDFAHFLKYIPGCLIFIGGNVESKEVYPLHNSMYDYNDDNIIKGAKLFEEIIRLRLNDY